MRKFILGEEIGGSFRSSPEPDVMKSVSEFSDVVKHPGHGDQKVHGRRGGSSLPEGWSKKSDEETIEYWATVARDDWGVTDPAKARQCGVNRAEISEFYSGPNGSMVQVQRGHGVTEADLAPTMERVNELQKIHPVPNQYIEVSTDAWSRFPEADPAWGGFAHPGKPFIYLKPSTVKDGLRPEMLMPSAKANKRAYAVTHEWGHTVDRRDKVRAAVDHATKALPMADQVVGGRTALSVYGRTDKRESYAEAFAEWSFTGQTTNPVVAYFHGTYNWGLEGSVEKALAAKSVTLIGDTFGEGGPGETESIDLSPFPELREEIRARYRKAAVVKFAPGLTPVLKHPGHGDQKVHGRRGSSSVDPDVAASILSRVKANGGLSVSMMDGSEPVKGFMVAKGGSKGAIVDAEEFYDPVKGPEHLSSFLKDHRSSLTKGSYLGLWHNTEDGKVYLDVSDNIMDEAKATSLGRRRDQISIWDVANFREIDTGGTGQLSKSESVEGDSTSRSDERDGRGDRQDRSGNLEQVRQSAVIKFVPGLVPVLKHGDPSRPGYAAMHPDSPSAGGASPSVERPGGFREVLGDDRLPQAMKDFIASESGSDPARQELIADMKASMLTGRVFRGPNNSEFQCDDDLSDENIDIQLKQLGKLQQIAPLADVKVIVSDSLLDGLGAGPEVLGAARSGSGEIFLREKAVTDGVVSTPTNQAMPGFKSQPRAYTITHEYGHLLDQRDDAKSDADYDEVRSRTSFKRMTRYGASNGRELFAESFTGFVGTRGDMGDPSHSGYSPSLGLIASKYGWTAPDRQVQIPVAKEAAEMARIIFDTFDPEIGPTTREMPVAEFDEIKTSNGVAP